MNVYDFDNTIIRGDSTALFTFYCMRHSAAVWRDLPGQALNALMYLLRRRTTQQFKQRLLAFLARLADVDATVERFWEENLRRVKPFYIERHRPDDVVISASPRFLIEPACARLGITTVIASPVDAHTGKFSGPNCHDEEKLRLFMQRFPGAQIDEFFSDSHSDDPLAALATRAWLVRGNELLPWDG